MIDDHLGFIERWRHRDGLNMLSSSTAELCDGLITFQHTNVSWDHRPAQPPAPAAPTRHE